MPLRFEVGVKFVSIFFVFVGPCIDVCVRLCHWVWNSLGWFVGVYYFMEFRILNGVSQQRYTSFSFRDM